MTNPTRTRAEIQAEIEKLKQELDAVPFDFKRGTRVWALGRVAEDGPDKDNDVLVEFVSSETDELYVGVTQIIPAADLIPREEHERALEEARKVTLTDAIIKLVAWHKENPSDQLDVVSDFSGLYRVTVERVDAKPEPADAEPVGWVADRGEAGLSSVLLDSEGQATRFNDGGPAVPLYRHPAPPADDEVQDAYQRGYADAQQQIADKCPDCGKPQGALIRELTENWNQIAQTKGEWTNSHMAITDILEKINRHPAPPQGTAVAPQGVVERIRSLVYTYSDFNCATEPVKADFEAALARITELPEPSTLERAIATVTKIGMQQSSESPRVEGIAAALLESEARDDHA